MDYLFGNNFIRSRFLLLVVHFNTVLLYQQIEINYSTGENLWNFPKNMEFNEYDI